ncbi:DNA-binding protein [Bacillus methanolicus]|uniref:DNA-binding protein n=1 Tax=Bacillus methanolicus TaxID=1471 RepID=UPI0023807B05|nr:DNA-binding protein [Bacillus methanolicus]MDE3840240.1 DNA-binding protein [Bacillus methanolicus]
MLSKKELCYIEDNLGRQSLKSIAKKLGRQPKSLEITLIRKRGTSNTKVSTGMITAGELAKTLQIDRNTVVGWIKRHGLPFSQRVTRYKKKFTFIDIEEFWKWAYENKERIDFSKLASNSLPPEPDWVKEERKRKKNVRNYRSWTTREEKQLIELAASGKSIQEIASILNRSTLSVEKKYYRLKRINGIKED